MSTLLGELENITASLSEEASISLNILEFFNLNEDIRDHHFVKLLNDVCLAKILITSPI